MSLAEVLSAIADVVITSEHTARESRWLRHVDMEPFLERFRAESAGNGVTPCSDDCFALDDAVLIH